MSIKQKNNHLKKFVTEKRFETFNRVLNHRTRYISVVLEDIFQTHNASAVLRSCDCFGIQDVHMIENRNEFNANPEIALGSYQWLSTYRHNSLKNNSLSTISYLKQRNYRIVATTPHTNDCALENLDLNKGKIALFFGSEQPGLSDIVMQNADEFVTIPMQGFTESFNISVSAAICLYDISNRLRKSEINWQLQQDEKDEIMFEWLKSRIKDSTNILKRFSESNLNANL
ncbi:MAG: RNA methyltransferase [Bacteroidales bacterium]|nr:RNA methyltransferase [Bacteroidales bacterium]MDY0143874.1 RNA methyltransferase [Bacteroidales bacterium]